MAYATTGNSKSSSKKSSRDRDRARDRKQDPDRPVGADVANQWFLAPEGDVHGAVFQFVRTKESELSDVFDRLATLELLYDPYSPSADDWNAEDAERRVANVSENVIASNVDTTYASVATNEVLPRFLTDGASWSTVRRAKKLEYYIEGLGKRAGVHRKARLGFKEAGKKGMGLTKVYSDAWGQVCCDHVRLEDIVVPHEDSRSDGPPVQLHHLQRAYDKFTLAAEHPEHAQAILESSTAWNNRTSLGVPGGTQNKIAVIESWRLPTGRKWPALRSKSLIKRKQTPYVPGRHTRTIANRTLIDEPYDKPFHPFAMVSWSTRLGAFYPISGAERIAGLQRSLNKRNWQIDRTLDQGAMVTTYVRPSDGNLVARTNRVGNVVVIKGEFPKTEAPPVVHPETYNSRVQLKDSAYEEYGNAKLTVQSKIPAGLETGAAVREWRDASSVRFSAQEKDFEQYVLDIYFLITDVCKDLGKEGMAPDVFHEKWGDHIKWEDVNLEDVQVQISAASTLPRTAAGREQTVLEWAQAGIISTDSARRMIGNPDLERELSLYTSAIDVIDAKIEDILEGRYAVPEAFDNVAMAQWRATGVYNATRIIKEVPEEILEALRDYIVLATWLNNQENAPPVNAAGAAAPPPPGADIAVPPGQLGAAPPPGAGAPPAAFSPQSLQLSSGQ